MLIGLNSIYVINVKSFTERRRFIESQLKRFNLEAEFILDWDKEELTGEIIDRYFCGDQLSAAQMSCALKHIVALRKIADNGDDGFSLILEDDAVLAGNFMEGVEKSLQDAQKFPGSKVIYIGSGGNFYTPRSQRRKDQHLYPGHRGRFTDSYLIDAETAGKRLHWIEQHKISHPIDNQFDTLDKALAIQILWLDEPVVEQGSKSGRFVSQIEKAPPKWLQAVLFAWEKLRRKYIYQLWK